MGQKKVVKLGDIAQELGVSIVSVSNALNGKKGVSAALRENVLRKAGEMGYLLPETPVKKENKTYHIGVVIAERYVQESPSFYMDIYKQVAQIATKRGNLIVLEIVNEAKERLDCLPELFLNVDISGMLLIGEMNPAFIREIKEQSRIPMVCVDFYSTAKDMDYIVTDSFHGMSAVVQKLIDAGHREIGFVGTPLATNSIMDRYMGYCKTLEKNEIKENPDWLIYDREENGYARIGEFELPAVLPSAFACNCDETAYRLIRLLKERGLEVPGDISVAGFDHLYTEGMAPLQLTTYESDKKAMALISVNTLIKRIEGKKKPEGIRVVEGRIVEGNTIKKKEGQGMHGENS